MVPPKDPLNTIPIIKIIIAMRANRMQCMDLFIQNSLTRLKGKVFLLEQVAIADNILTSRILFYLLNKKTSWVQVYARQ